MGNLFPGGGGPPPPFDFMQCSNSNTQVDCCNGLDGLCAKRPDEIMWATSHNAMSSNEGGLPLFYNHLYELEDSLQAGYRGIGLDLCNCNGFQFCHGICTIGARNVVEVLENIVDFMMRNPTEFILITLQIDSNAGRDVSLDEFYQFVKEEVPAVLDLLYEHPDTAVSWPTLATLKSLNKRLFIFHHEGPDCSSKKPCPPGFHYWFQYAAETQFSFQEIADLETKSTACQITRGNGGSKDFFGVNAFTTPASKRDSEVINQQEWLESHIDACSSENGGLDVNLVNVDYWSVGDLPKLVQERNKALIA